MVLLNPVVLVDFDLSLEFGVVDEVRVEGESTLGDESGSEDDDAEDGELEKDWERTTRA